jgi:hypothetical protein
MDRDIRSGLASKGLTKLRLPPQDYEKGIHCTKNLTAENAENV